MKGIRVHAFGTPEVMQWGHRASLAPQDDEVLVTVKAAGVNPVDAYIREGNYPLKPKLPYTPGFDGAGVVRAVGRKVKGFAVGDRVYISGSLTGTYAQEVLCQVDQVYPLPEELSFEQGAAVGIPYMTAYTALFTKASAHKGEIVLVHGASGGVGLAAVQLARASGLTVWGTAGSREGSELVKNQGAEKVFSHSQTDYREAIFSATDGRGVNVILEMRADLNLQHDLELLAKGGRIVVIGCRGEVTINPRVLMRQEGAVIGIFLFHLSAEEKQRIHTFLWQGWTQGLYRPVIGAIFPLSQANHAHEQILTAQAKGKVILTTEERCNQHA
jgi:NADPH2:quinone reductase